MPVYYARLTIGLCTAAVVVEAATPEYARAFIDEDLKDATFGYDDECNPYLVHELPAGKVLLIDTDG
jgi:hypothetical protein